MRLHPATMYSHSSLHLFAVGTYRQTASGNEQTHEARRQRSCASRWKSKIGTLGTRGLEIAILSVGTLIFKTWQNHDNLNLWTSLRLCVSEERILSLDHSGNGVCRLLVLSLLFQTYLFAVFELLDEIRASQKPKWSTPLFINLFVSSHKYAE